MRDLIGLRVRLLLLPGLCVCDQAPEEVHKAGSDAAIALFRARGCSPLVRDTIVTQNASSTHVGTFEVYQ